ncbi:MAG: transcriptional regulator, partial [Nitrosopumilaceae archaeon]
SKKEEKKTPATSKKEEKKTPATSKKEEKKTPATSKKEEKKTLATSKKEEKKTLATSKKEEKKTPATSKKEEKKIKEELEKEENKTYEEELEEQLTDEEIQNFQIEKMDMEKLTNKVCDIVAKYETDGMLQSELWKKLKLTSRDGSRLALKLERLGIISREKILEKGRWTYKLIIKRTPVSTESIENAPCLTCPVEQKCSLEGEISPLTCQLIEDWVLVDITKSKK